MRKFMKIVRIVLTSILAIPTFSVVVFLFEKNILNIDYPTLFNIGSSTVITGSMEPEITPGDMVFTVRKVSYEVGDIITYTSDTSFVTHRIIRIEGENYYTQGDANNVSDSAPVTINQIQGKVFLKLKGLGNAALFLKSAEGLIFMICMITLIEVVTVYPFKIVYVNMIDLVPNDDFTIEKVIGILDKTKKKIDDKEYELYEFITKLAKRDYDQEGISKLQKQAETYFTNDFLKQMNKTFQKNDFVDEVVGEVIYDLKPQLRCFDNDDANIENLYKEFMKYKANIVNNIMDIIMTQDEKFNYFKEKGLPGDISKKEGVNHEASKV